MTNITLLGSTGSIGQQTLDIVRNYPNLLKINTLTAAHNWELLASQAIEFKAERVAIADPIYYNPLKEALSQHSSIEVLCGEDAISEVVALAEVDVAVIAVVGFAGLAPTISAIKARKRVALANKESLVVGGELVMPLAMEYGVQIMPIDSEHSAIFQCLVGEENPVKRILLTASGGSLRDVELNDLATVTAQQVLKHPVWDMGARITVDSATMLNKGFEIIEAAHLYGIEANKIQVVVHPQSIIHSAVEFIDNSIKAQMGYPDMRLPIQYALTYPTRMEVNGLESFNPFLSSELTFREPDIERYPCLQLSYNAINCAGVMPTALNASGEIAVEAFLAGKIGYLQIAETISETLDKTQNEKLVSIEQIFEADKRARELAISIVNKNY